MFLCFSLPASAGIRYVDLDAPPGGSGTSWSSPYKYLQDALAAAVSGDEIRVAQGTYRPDQGGGMTVGDKNATFLLKTGVTIKGGYVGYDQSLPDRRDINLYPTSLSGDLLGDDVGWGKVSLDPSDTGDLAPPVQVGVMYQGTFSEGTVPYDSVSSCISDPYNNSRDVWYRYTAQETKTIDIYVRLPDGVSAVWWTQIAVHSAWPGTLENELACNNNFNHVTMNVTAGLTYYIRITEVWQYEPSDFEMRILPSDNSYHVVTASGTTSTAVLDGFIIERGFSENSMHGAGLYGENAGATIRYCTFRYNTLIGEDNYGAAAANFAESQVNYLYCRFHDNHTEYSAIVDSRNSNTTFKNCVFYGNYSYMGAISYISYATAHTGTIQNCLIYGNYGDNIGGVLVNADTLNITSTTIADNFAYNGRGGLYCAQGSTANVTNSIIWGNAGNYQPYAIQEHQVDGWQSTFNISYSCIQDTDPDDPDIPFGGSANYNIDDDPMLISTIGLDGQRGSGDENLRLHPDSPCIDAGNNSAASSLYYDLDNRPRKIDHPGRADTGSGTVPIIDMGAYETRIVFVDADAAGWNDGSTWLNAYVYLQHAFSDIRYGDSIWVAEGTYRPDLVQDGEIGNVWASFYIPKGVALYGGFVGGETLLSQRDPINHPSILTGDLNGDDGPNFTNRADNSWNIATISNGDAFTLLDGFIIRGGNYASLGSAGAGLKIYGGSPAIIRCVFMENMAPAGGGAVHINTGAKPRFYNCAFNNNKVTQVSFPAPSYGGAVWNEGASDSRFYQCVFSGNTAAGKGGAIGNANTQSKLLMVNCSLDHNTAATGGAIHTYGGAESRLMNAICWANIASQGSQLSIDNASLDVEYSDIQGGQGGISNAGGTLNWGSGNIDADPRFANALGADGVAGSGDEDFRLKLLSPCIDAGRKDALEGDFYDLDQDYDQAESLPQDFYREIRYLDDPRTADTGTGSAPMVDIGAAEHRYTKRDSYVDADATSGANDGSNWDNAFLTLQDALDFVVSGETIYVAKGIYKPDQGQNVVPGSRTATFTLKKSVAMRGGYAGFGQPDPNVRDINLYESVLSGDLAGNDGADFANYDENSYHVVTCLEGTYPIEEATLLDGFTLSGGNADGGYPHNGGGALRLSWANPQIIDCLFKDNRTSQYGGGAYLYNSTPGFVRCEFVHNWSWGDNGGGCFNHRNSHATYTNCVFRQNNAVLGGGIYVNDSSRPLLQNCLFYGNEARGYGGAIYSAINSQPSINQCTVAYNIVQYGIACGGIYCNTGVLYLNNSLLWGNTDPSGSGEFAQIKLVGVTSIQVRHCGIQDDNPDDASIPYNVQTWNNMDDNPLFVNALGPDGQAGTEDDDLHCSILSPYINKGDSSLCITDHRDMDEQSRLLYETVDIGADEVIPIAGDTDADADVDADDLLQFSVHWLQSGCIAPNWCSKTDVDQDGSVNLLDVAWLGRNWLLGID